MRHSTNSSTALSRFTHKVSPKFLFWRYHLSLFLVSAQLFENIGTLKYNIVSFSNKHTFKFFNNKVKPINKLYYFGDSNNP